MSEIPGGNSKPKHEISDADVRGVTIFGISLFVLMVLVFILMIGLFQYFNSLRKTETTQAPLMEEPLKVEEEAPVLPPEPRLQVAPEVDLAQLRAEEDSILHSYGWISKEGAVVRVPIDRAMEMILERGFPTRTKGGEVQR